MARIQIEADAQGAVLDMVKEAIAAEIKRLEIGLLRTERLLAEREKKYGISSELFLEQYAAEDLAGGDQEYMEWAGEVQILARITDDLRRLKAIEYVAH
ncbi:MAG: hypothetical protein AB1634_00545 [Thermodesulfobacteriota bacterium]